MIDTDVTASAAVRDVTTVPDMTRRAADFDNKLLAAR